jgi:hypothetical protein
MKDEASGEPTAPPGEIMRMVAAGLAEAGYEVWLPDHPDDRCLVVMWRRARCLLTVTDWGQAEWEYRPRNSVVPAPRWLAALTAALLTGQAGTASAPKGAQDRAGLSSRALAGLELRARGFDITLDVVTDTECLEAYAEIVVTVPGCAEAADVRITDEGTVTWTRNYWADPDSYSVAWGDPRTWMITDPPALADDIVGSLVRAMRGTVASIQTATGPLAACGSGPRLRDPYP